MRKKFELGSSEEYYWKEWIKYNRVKYLFLFFLGFCSGIVVISFLYLSIR